MKTLHLTNAWHPASGGIRTFYMALLQAAEREGHELRLVVPGDETSVEETGRFGRIYRIEAPPAPLSADYRIIYPHRYLLPGTALRRILNAERPDLVEVSEKYTMPYLAGLLRTGRLPGVAFRPTVVGMSCERMDENFSAYLSHLSHARAGGRFCRNYMKWIYFPSFDHHISVSEHVAEELVDASRGHKVRRGIWVEPMGLDSERFSRARRLPGLRAELLGGQADIGGTTLLLYAGRLAPEKNLQLLVDTMAALDARQYRLAIAGDGIQREFLQSEFERCGIRNAVFLGHIADRDRLAGIYAASDIFLHPNPREPFGIAPLEAMAAGLALVAPRSGGITSYANDGNAWLSEPTGESFAASVRLVRSDGELTRQRLAGARLTAARYAWPAVTSRFLRLYSELHGLTQRADIRIRTAPRYWSTPGDAFGREFEAPA